MALYVRRDQEDSELQNQITRNLRDKQKLEYEREHAPKKEQVDLSEGYKQGTKSSSPLMAVWIIILIAALAVSIWLIVVSS